MPSRKFDPAIFTHAPQTLNMIERLSAEPIQQKQGFRENDSTFARVKNEVP
jgi:hypothetical protein